MLGRMLTIYGVVRRVFGRTITPLFTGWLLINFQIYSRVTLWLDNLFFPGYRDQKVDRPIFIMSNPRSGTTVMQRFLESSGVLCSFQVWQMIVPSILGQKLIKPFIPFLARFNPGRHYMKGAHETGLDSVETDEVLLSFRFLDGLFVLLFFLGWDEGDRVKELLASHARGSDKNRRELAYYAQCVKRNLKISGKQRVLGKPFTFVLRTEDVLEQFPDAKMIYMVRDPVSVIPSGMNMLSNATDNMFKTKSLPDDVRQRYFENLYQGEVALYRQFHEAYKSGKIPEENLLIVRFPDLMQNFEKVMEDILEFTGIEVGEEYMEEVRAQAEKQRSYVSGHKYDLADFGITEERIRKDLAFVYEEFDL